MPKNRNSGLSSAECDVHVKAVDMRRAKLREDRRRDEVRQVRDGLRDELEDNARRLPEWQVQHAMRNIRSDELGQAAAE
jgi:hypothetical protein